MNCQCQGIEETFSPEYVAGELRKYRRRGARGTTRLLVEAIRALGVEGLSLLDIGGGLGAISHALLPAGVTHVTGVDASSAYLDAAREEMQRRGLAERARFLHGNFVDLASGIPPAGIVTLDRVICCYDDMERLVDLSAARAQQVYGLVFPRDTPWVRLGAAVLNVFERWSGSPFLSFIHPTHAVEEILRGHGFERRYFRRTLAWQVAVYSRAAGQPFYG